MPRVHLTQFSRSILASVTCAVAVGLLALNVEASDPIRNVNPEQAAPQEDRENPIYFQGPFPGAGVGDVSGVVPEALLQEFLHRHSAMDYPGAAEAAMRLIEATPDRPVGHYNLACALARMGRVDEALQSLRQAIDSGWRDAVHCSIDPDLASLRSTDGYAAVLAHLHDLNEAEQVVPQPLRSDPWPNVVADLVRQAPSILDHYHVPGATIALIHDGQVVWSSAFGERSTHSSVAAGADDRYRLRAPLHLLAIAACVRLEFQQKLQFAALIAEAAELHSTMTIVQSSTGPGVRPASNRQSSNNEPGIRSSRGSEFVARVLPASRMFSRSSVYGFWRLAIEAAIESSFTRFCERELFVPLMLRASGFAEPAEAASTAVGHSALGTPLRPNVMQGEFAPGGCVYMTAADVGRLIAGSMPSISADKGTGKDLIVGDESTLIDDRAAFDSARFANAIELATRANAELAGGLGLAIRRAEHDGKVVFEMNESAAGIVLLARWHPDSARGVVILCNSVTAPEAARRLAQLALGGY